MAAAKNASLQGCRAIITGASSEATRRQAVERVPLKRFASPEEIVTAIRFLAVDAPFATGAVLPVDGGTTMV